MKGGTIAVLAVATVTPEPSPAGAGGGSLAPLRTPQAPVPRPSDPGPIGDERVRGCQWQALCSGSHCAVAMPAAPRPSQLQVEVGR